MSLRNGAKPKGSTLLTPAQRMALYIIGIGVWLSGAVWLIAHYFMVRNGQFGPEKHPLEFWSLAAHGAFAFASLWLFGLLWGTHIVAGWKSLRRRWSGGLMVGLMFWLIVSGYLLYYLGNDEMLSTVALLHWAVGLACPIPFIIHRFVKDR